VEDDFFELGGHSLVGIQIISRVREVFAVHLPLKNLFISPTIAALGREIDGLRVSANDSKGQIEKIQRQRPRQSPADVDELSDSEVDVLLKNLMTKNSNP
jgi:hypothetical protein